MDYKKIIKFLTNEGHKPCMKKPVRLRIDCKNQLINYEKWFVYKGATTVIESTES